ncbi:MAG: pilus assembly protein TadG-related protein [Planctomycetota bacterium]|nr:pilus assembly protein TadG-related protein [Planctomycetota bacterium]
MSNRTNPLRENQPHSKSDGHPDLGAGGAITVIASRLARVGRRFRDLPGRLHRDERGALSMLSVIVILALTMVLGMIINVGKHVDDKIKMQNAADASAYSSTLVVARGMNAISFSNHLLCDTFAITAFLREARDRNAEAMVPEILTAWSNVGQIFSKSQFPKFRTLGSAIQNKVPDEKELVRTFGELGSAIAQEILPVMEYSLRERLIPEFQRAVVQTMPRVAQATANDVAGRHGQHSDPTANRKEERERGRQVGILWRTSVIAVGYPDERDPQTRTLPAIDPEPGSSLGVPQPIPDPNPDGMEGNDYQAIPGAGSYLKLAIQQREQLSRMYLNQWVNDRLRFFAVEGKMSQYINLYHVFSCGQLMKLLNEEYPFSNLPHMIRLADNGVDPNKFRNCTDCLAASQNYLDQNFMFVGVAYRRQMKEMMHGLFRYPLSHDPLAFTQVEMFVPKARMWYHDGSAATSPPSDIGGGGVGVNVPIPLDPPPAVATPPGWGYEGWPGDWSLLTQNWTVRLVPATHANILSIIQTQPPPDAIATGQPLTVVLPSLRGIDMRMLREINNH